MAVVVAFLRTLGIAIFPYLDDGLLVGPSEESLARQVPLVLSQCERLGLVINDKKSVLVPARLTKFIGADLDSTLGRAFLGNEG